MEICHFLKQCIVIKQSKNIHVSGEVMSVNGNIAVNRDLVN